MARHVSGNGGLLTEAYARACARGADTNIEAKTRNNQVVVTGLAPRTHPNHTGTMVATSGLTDPDLVAAQAKAMRQQHPKDSHARWQPRRRPRDGISARGGGGTPSCPSELLATLPLPVMLNSGNNTDIPGWHRCRAQPLAAVLRTCAAPEMSAANAGAAAGSPLLRSLLSHPAAFSGAEA